MTTAQNPSGGACLDATIDAGFRQTALRFEKAIRFSMGYLDVKHERAILW
jgi:hypothetical protein